MISLLVIWKKKDCIPGNNTPDGKGWLLVEFGGKDKEESDKKAEINE